MLSRGSYKVEATRVTSFLRDASRHHANRALKFGHSSTAEFEQLDAAISVGTAVELTAKALVTTIHAPLLVKSQTNKELKSAHGALIFSGNAGLGMSMYDFQTIDASVAVSLVQQLKLAPGQVNVKKALDVRNLAVHMSVVHTSDLIEAVGQMTAYINASLADLETTAEDFWGESQEAAHDAVRVRDMRTKEAAQAAIQKSMDLFESKFGELDTFQMAAIARMLVDSYDIYSDSTAELDCPACSTLCPIGIDMDWDVERVGDAYDAIPVGPVVLDFHCPACGLDLTPEELDAVGIDTSELLGYE
jgi:hypothetical protein